MKVKVKGKIYLVRKDYICVALADENENITIYRDLEDDTVYKVNDKFNKVVNLGFRFLSGQYRPVKTYIFYLQSGSPLFFIIQNVVVYII